MVRERPKSNSRSKRSFSLLPVRSIREKILLRSSNNDIFSKSVEIGKYFFSRKIIIREKLEAKDSKILGLNLLYISLSLSLSCENVAIYSYYFA